MNVQAYFPVNVMFRNLEPSKAIENQIHKHADKLGRYFDKIMGCQVAVELPKHQHKGNIYQIRIELQVPNAELIATRDPAENHAHEDVYVAIRDAFNAIKRQLKEYTDKLRGDVKRHSISMKGRVLEIFGTEHYGYIETIDGRRVRFTNDDVIEDDPDKLAVGSMVDFMLLDRDGLLLANSVHIT